MNDHTKFLAFVGILGFLLGGSRALLANDPRMRARHVLARCIVSAAVGLCVAAALIYAWGEERLYLAMGAAAACSWVGVELMKDAGRIVIRLKDRGLDD